MWKFFISIFFLSILCSTAQESDSITVANDSLVYKKKYGLRLGIDAASLVRTFVDENYTGIQLLGDYRITKEWYAAAELGTEEIGEILERVSYETQGAFIKVGADYNFYGNWLDMDNMIYMGARIGYSNFSQTLKGFQVNNDNNYFLPQPVITDREFSGLSSTWFELQAGIKVEVLNNIYLTGNVQLRRLITNQEPDGFGNLFIPGFGKTNDNSNIGVGYLYGITYRLPLYKR